MGESWSKIPNALLEDAAGKPVARLRREGEIDKEGGLRPPTQYRRSHGCNTSPNTATVTTGILPMCAGLPWLSWRADLPIWKHVQRAVMEERQAGFKPRRPPWGVAGREGQALMKRDKIISRISVGFSEREWQVIEQAMRICFHAKKRRSPADLDALGKEHAHPQRDLGICNAIVAHRFPLRTVGLRAAP